MARMSEREERGSKRGFVLRRTAENVKARANMKGGGFDSIFKPKYKVLKVRDGKNLIRILPATWEDATHYGYDLWVNYAIGADNQSYLSLKMMKQEKDPLDEARAEALHDGDKKLAAALKPRQRILMWVIDRNEEDEGPQLFACPFSLDKAIANLSMDEDTKEVIYVDDEKEGCDIRFYKEGAGINTDYPAEKIRILKPSPLCDDEGLAEEWMEFIQNNPLPECIQFYDYDHIAAAFDGTVRVDRDPEEEKPARHSRGNGRASEDDDDGDSNRPSRSRTSASNRDDEAEDNARPHSSRRSSRATEADDEPKLRRGRAAPASEADDTEEETDNVRSKRRTDQDGDEGGKKRQRLDADPDEQSDRRRPSIRERLSKSSRSRDEDDD